MKNNVCVSFLVVLTCAVIIMLMPSVIHAREASSVNSLLDTLNGELIVRHSGEIKILTEKEIVVTSRGGREKFVITQNTHFCIDSKRKELLSELKVGLSATVTTRVGERTALSIRDGGIVFTMSQFGTSPANNEACDRYVVSSWNKKVLVKVIKVCEVQELLNDLGYASGEVDGIYGKNTSTAIKQYLKNNEIKEKVAVSDSVIKVLRASYDPKKNMPKTNIGSLNSSRPQNGQEFKHANAKEIAPLKVIVPNKGHDFVVKLVRKKNGEHVKTFYVRGGASHKTQLPLGQLELKYAAGEMWYSKNCLFGRNTIYSKADKVLDFSQNGQIVSGNSVELILQEGGNLSTSKISQDKW